MTISRKLIAGVLVATIALTGILVGTISADRQPGADGSTGIIARVAEILGLPQQQVESAFQQAMQEQRQETQSQLEAARDARIQELIDQGALTQEQADAWEAWLAARPDNPDEMQAWFEARPDMGGTWALGQGFCGGGPGRYTERPMTPRGPMGGMHEFPGQCPACRIPA